MTISVNIQKTKWGNEGGKQNKQKTWSWRWWRTEGTAEVWGQWAHTETPEGFKRKPYFQETGNWKPAGNWHQVSSHFKEWEGNIEYGFKGQFNPQNPLCTQVGTNVFYTQLRSLLQFLVRETLTPIASVWLQRVGKLLWDFVFIPTLFQKQHKVSYKNKIETLQHDNKN